ncbi:hypothetical protein [Acidiferrobacter sp.]|uniref:hypothetical protein n=1 Tax=Acidiferrobacter sp. TaxID=1872107 RepID=UPI002614BBE5|nr:hypothetical protein [Acidiferrobacter sp.]
MDYQQAENQLTVVQQQNQAVLQKLQALAQKFAAAAPDPTTGREWAMDLREIAMMMQTQAQGTTTLIQQMAQYIQQLEGTLATHPNPPLQPTGWANQAPQQSGGGFMGSLVSGLGMGAGFAVADDVVSDLFNLF